MFTDTKYKIHNSKFRKALVGNAGKRYQKEVRAIREKHKTDPMRQCLTNGAELPFFCILHVPMPAYSLKDNLRKYVEMMMKCLERGLGYAVLHGMRRVLISVCGLRLGDLPWEVAEQVAVKGTAHFAQGVHLNSSLKEIVIFTAEKLLNARLSKAMPIIQEKAAPKEKKQRPRAQRVL